MTLERKIEIENTFKKMFPKKICPLCNKMKFPIGEIRYCKCNWYIKIIGII